MTVSFSTETGAEYCLGRKMGYTEERVGRMEFDLYRIRRPVCMKPKTRFHGLIKTLPPFNSSIVPVFVNGVTRITTVAPVPSARSVPGVSN
jgi:hypothetical protein